MSEPVKGYERPDVSDPLNDIITAPLVAGSGVADGNECSVEMLGRIIYGHHDHGYTLPCLDRGAQAATVEAQDKLSDEARNSLRWRMILCRLATCHTMSERAQHRAALWCARSVEHLSDDPRVKECNDTLERWLAGEATDAERAAAAAAVEARAARAAAGVVDDVLMDWIEEYLEAIAKIAADEGCAIPDEQEQEYVAFVDALNASLSETP